ncbi:hypothetical protein PFISCL1PPCAC_11948 [Pristionchus fissidentatus]|uniref:Uncharacterized protein n=1 Tax=Pristionchus fissidentatus TaxID=1538716 RepID=A0AAV5VML6_9BILA|nr:hypothetical protein PFISCL1PPCAC_11948 [Pristionchus fissidentatus]
MMLLVESSLCSAAAGQYSKSCIFHDEHQSNDNVSFVRIFSSSSFVSALTYERSSTAVQRTIIVNEEARNACASSYIVGSLKERSAITLLPVTIYCKNEIIGELK